MVYGICLHVQIWHKTCFKCWECGMTLNMKNYKGFDKKPYCSAWVLCHEVCTCRFCRCYQYFIMYPEHLYVLGRRAKRLCAQCISLWLSDDWCILHWWKLSHVLQGKKTFWSGQSDAPASWAMTLLESCQKTKFAGISVCIVPVYCMLTSSTVQCCPPSPVICQHLIISSFHGQGHVMETRVWLCVVT